MDSPLKGVRVLAFQALPPLQFTCHMLETSGAEIVTVVNAKKPALDFLAKDFFAEGPRQELQLDLKSEKDRTYLFAKVLPITDVLLESYRPGTMEKLGLSPEKVHAVNPKIIYGRLSGYG